MIQEAYAFFETALEDWLKDDPNGLSVSARLVALRTVVRDHVKLVVIDLERDDNAQVIFETLNARGTPLLAIDLVKNLVFQRAEVAGVDLEAMYENDWAPFDQAYWRRDVRQGRLTRARAELFLMHWLTMQLADEVKVHQLFTKFRSLLDAPDANAIGTVVKDFAADAEVFASFENQLLGSVEERFFSRLSALDTTTPLPLALFLMRQPENVLPRNRLQRAFSMIESWLVRRMICRLTPKNYNRFFIELLQAVKANPEVADEAILDHLTAADKDTNIWPKDGQVDEVLLDVPIYKRQVTIGRTAMLLTAAEEMMRGEHSEDVPIPPGLSIEHVMPRSWHASWPVPPDDLAAQAERDGHIDRLGNLTLVTHELNSSVSNGPWEKKRASLNEHSSLWLNRRIVDAHSEGWDESAIDARSAELAGYLKEAWPGPTSDAWTG